MIESKLRRALAEISLCSQNSASSKEQCGRIARAALAAWPASVEVKITTAIESEYVGRCPEDIPSEYRTAGMKRVPIAVAIAMLEDAEYHCDRNGPLADGGPEYVGLRSAYRAHRNRIRALLAAYEGSK